MLIGDTCWGKQGNYSLRRPPKLIIPQARPAKLAELPRSEFDTELFSHTAYVNFFVIFATNHHHIRHKASSKSLTNSVGSLHPALSPVFMTKIIKITKNRSKKIDHSIAICLFFLQVWYILDGTWWILMSRQFHFCAIESIYMDMYMSILISTHTGLVVFQ